MDWCPCFTFCCKKSDSETGPLSASYQSPLHGSYTVRRISSFGQTVINEKGEECEIGRHCSIEPSYNNGVTIPWTSKPTVVQPGVTEADLVGRVRKMPTITEADLSPATKQKSRWKKALSTVKKKEFSPLKQKDKSPKNEIAIKQIKYHRKDGHETSYSHDDILRTKKNSSHTIKGLNNVRRSSYLMVAVPPPITVSSPDLVHTDISTSQFTFTVTDSTSDLMKKADTVDRLSPASSSSWLKSQSMLDMNNENKAEREREKLARMWGLDLSLYQDDRTNIKKSNEALNRALKPANAVEDIWREEPAGTISFTAHYDHHSKQLHVCINKIEGLCGEGIKREPFSAVVKLCILPSKKHDCSTKLLPRSLNPSVNQTFSFFIRDTTEKILRLSVFNSDWQGTHDAVGHSLFFVEDASEQPSTYQMKLYNQSTEDGTPGMLQLSLGYSKDTYSITVIKAFKLLPQISNCKAYIKVSYYSQSRKLKERVSQACSVEEASSQKSSSSSKEEGRGDERGEGFAVFNHSSKFKIKPAAGEPTHGYFVVSLKKRSDSYKVFKNDRTLGRILIGPYFFYENGRKMTPWGRTVINQEQLCNSFRMYF